MENPFAFVDRTLNNLSHLVMPTRVPYLAHTEQEFISVLKSRVDDDKHVIINVSCDESSKDRLLSRAMGKNGNIGYVITCNATVDREESIRFVRKLSRRDLSVEPHILKKLNADYHFAHTLMAARLQIERLVDKLPLIVIAGVKTDNRFISEEEWAQLDELADRFKIKEEQILDTYFQ